MGNSKTTSEAAAGKGLRVCLLTIFIAMTFLQTGCQMFDRFRNKPAPAPIAFTNVPTQEELLAHFNQQVAKVSQLKSNVQVSMAGIPTKLRGTLSVELPRKFRLKAGVMGVSELGVDVGSNDEEFWIWSKASLPGETPALYYANHDAFEQSAVRRSIPIKPEWLIDALGLITPRSGDRFVGPTMRPDGWLQFDTYRQSVTGTSIRRSLIDAKTGLIEQQAIYDGNGNRVAYVNSTNHKLDTATGVSLPHRLELFVSQPDGKTLTLTMNADSFSTNSLYGDPDKIWAMPNSGDDPMIDLTRLEQQVQNFN